MLLSKPFQTRGSVPSVSFFFQIGGVCPQKNNCLGEGVTSPRSSFSANSAGWSGGSVRMRWGWPPEEQAFLEHLSGWGIGADFLRIAQDERSKKAGMQRCCNVYRTAVNAYHCSGRADQADELRIKITGLSPEGLKAPGAVPSFSNRRGLSPAKRKFRRSVPILPGCRANFGSWGVSPKQ